MPTYTFEIGGEKINLEFNRNQHSIISDRIELYDFPFKVLSLQKKLKKQLKDVPRGKMYYGLISKMLDLASLGSKGVFSEIKMRQYLKDIRELDEDSFLEKYKELNLKTGSIRTIKNVLKKKSTRKTILELCNGLVFKGLNSHEAEFRGLFEGGLKTLGCKGDEENILEGFAGSPYIKIFEWSQWKPKPGSKISLLFEPTDPRSALRFYSLLINGKLDHPEIPTPIWYEYFTDSDTFIINEIQTNKTTRPRENEFHARIFNQMLLNLNVIKNSFDQIDIDYETQIKKVEELRTVCFNVPVVETAHTKELREQLERIIRESPRGEELRNTANKVLKAQPRPKIIEVLISVLGSDVLGSGFLTVKHAKEFVKKKDRKSMRYFFQNLWNVLDYHLVLVECMEELEKIEDTRFDEQKKMAVELFQNYLKCYEKIMCLEGYIPFNINLWEYPKSPCIRNIDVLLFFPIVAKIASDRGFKKLVLAIQKFDTPEVNGLYKAADIYKGSKMDLEELPILQKMTQKFKDVYVWDLK